MRTFLYLVIAAALLLPLAVLAEVYTWVDESGRRHYSDKKPTKSGHGYESVSTTPQNLLEIAVPAAPARSAAEDEVHVKDTFRMPRRKSDIQHRFSLTTGLNGGEPRDRLNRINIGMHQKQMHLYVKLIGVERDTPYTLRYRVLDAKGELIFDKDHTIATDTNSLWFSASVTPAVTVDAPGTWTFQGILDERSLFVERRKVLF